MKLIELSKSGEKKGKYFAKVDDADYEWLSQYKWYVLNSRKNIYATGCKNGKTILMHRLILGITSFDICADHIDHDGLNNQRSNLRIATRKENARNRTSKGGHSKFLGVRRAKSKKEVVLSNGTLRVYSYTYWTATIIVDGKVKHLGSFQNEEDAAMAYDAGAKKYFADFANPNFK